MYRLNEDFFKECFACLKRDKAAGIDGVTVEEYEANLDENLKDLVARMKAWHFRFSPARRVYIPKGNGKVRPLGIPSVEDKIVQLALKKILEAIYTGPLSNALDRGWTSCRYPLVSDRAETAIRQWTPCIKR